MQSNRKSLKFFINEISTRHENKYKCQREFFWKSFPEFSIESIYSVFGSRMQLRNELRLKLYPDAYSATDKFRKLIEVVRADVSLWNWDSRIVWTLGEYVIIEKTNWNVNVEK